MKHIKLFEQFVNEKVSLSQMKKDIKTKEYKEVSQAINNAEEVADIWNMLDPKMFKFTESEFEDIFDDWWNNISRYDSIEDFSRNAFMEDVHSLYIHLLPYVSESVVNEDSKDRMIKQIERALKDGDSIFKLPMATQKYYYKNKGDFGTVTEGSARDPESIRKEYKELKKQSIGNLRTEWSRSFRVGDPKGIDKTGLISDILRARHGNKYVNAAFESVVSEGKMPNKFIGNDEIVFLKTKENSRGAHYNLYYKGHDIDLGGRFFGSEKELKSFADDYILSIQWYNKLKYEDSKPLPEEL